MGRFRPPGPILLLALAAVLVDSGTLVSRPVTAYLVAAREQAPADPATPTASSEEAAGLSAGLSAGLPAGPSIDALEAQMFTRVNAERAAAGVGPLQNQPWAHSVARQHSQDMAAAQNIWHNMTGYMDEGHHVLGATFLGENVSMDRTLDANDALLFASPEHHQNIVDPRFNYVGIGIARDSNNWVYVTEDFSDIPHGNPEVSMPAARPAPAPAPPDPAPASVRAPVPAQARPAAPPAPSRPLTQPALGGTAPRPDSPAPIAASPPTLALPAPTPQGSAVPAPVKVPGAVQVPAAADVPVAPALSRVAPPGDATPPRGGSGSSQPIAGWLSHTPERARRLLPAAGLALLLGALLLGRKLPGLGRPPHPRRRQVAGSGNHPPRIRGREDRPRIPELARGPPAVGGMGCWWFT